MRQGIAIVVVVTAVVAAVSLPATAQQAALPQQSLSAKVKQKYLERRGELVRHVKDVYFAVGCKILPSEAGARSLARKDSYLASVREQAVLDMKENEELVEAARQAGLNRASKPGACDYYRQHPEAAAAIRRSAADEAKQ